MNFFLVVTIMSINMNSSTMAVTKDHVVNERYTSEGECTANLQAHMSTHLRPGHMWAGTQPHPSGRFKQCQPG